MKKYIILKTIVIIVLLFLVSCELQVPDNNVAIDISDEIKILSISTNEANAGMDEYDNYPFFENGWRQTTIDNINDKETLYAVSLFNNKIHFMEYIDDFDANSDFKVLRYKTREYTTTFVGYDYGEFYGGGGLHCIPEDEAPMEEKPYYVAGNRVTDLFLYKDEVYYCSSTGFGWGNQIGKVKYDNINGVWIDDEDFKVGINYTLSTMAPRIHFNYPAYAHYIDSKGDLYILSSDCVYLYLKDENTLKIAFENKDWELYNYKYPIVKIDDTFYTGMYGGIASYNPLTGEQYIWRKEE